MFSDKVFQITLLISLAAHVIILSRNPNLNLSPIKKIQQSLEVRYVKPPKEIASEPKAHGQRKIDPFLKFTQKITAEKRNPPPFIDKNDMFNKAGRKTLADSGFTKPPIIKPDIIAIKKKISMPLVDLDKINNPSYLGYYQIVREKIRRAAYYNYTRTEIGEIYVSFTISSNGNLKEARLVDEKSSQNYYLREIALRSVKDASPFPVFPKELDYPTLSFNVVISFEIE
jgi:TonB family protein